MRVGQLGHQRHRWSFRPPAFTLHPSSFVSLALDIFLILLIVIGIFFRFNWSNWSQGTDLHPDEYGLTSTLTQLHIPDTLGDYFQYAHLVDEPVPKI